MTKISNTDNLSLAREWRRAREQIVEQLEYLNEPCLAIDVSAAMDTADYLTNLFSDTTVSDCDWLMVHRDDDTIVGSFDGGTVWYSLFDVADPDTIQTGMIFEYAGIVAQVPDGYLLCDGQAVSRATYTNLFAVIGTDFGSGDGSTTFNLPDTRGLVLMDENDGVGNSLTVRAIDDEIGSETHTTTESELAAHVHNQNPQNSRNSGNSGATGRIFTGSGQVQPTGGDGAHNNISPIYGLHYIIKT